MIWLVFGLMTLAAAGLIVLSLYGTHEDGKHHLAGPIALSILLPLAAFALYLLAGFPGLSAAYFHSSQQEIALLERSLAKEPDNTDNWLALANLYTNAKRENDAAKAWGKAAELAKDNLNVQLDYAAFLLTLPSSQNLLPPNFPALIQRIEQMAPTHPLTLFYKGLVAKSVGKKEDARQEWMKLLGLLPSESPLRPVLEKELQDLQ